MYNGTLNMKENDCKCKAYYNDALKSNFKGV